MKKFTKIFIIIGVVALVAAIALFVGGMSAAGWDFSKLNTVQYRQCEYAPETGSEVTGVTVRYQNADITVVYSQEAENAHVSYPVRVDKDSEPLFEVTVSYTNGVLSIIESDEGPSDIFSFNLSTPEVTVTLPADTACTLDIETDNGNISLRSPAQIASPSVRLASDNGNILAKPEGGALVGGEVSIATANGRIELNSVSAEDGVVLESDNGDIAAQDVRAAALSVKTDNGDIRIENAAVSGGLKAESDVGDITLRGSVQAKSCTLVNDPGDITVAKGAVLDAETIEMRTDVGDIRVRGALAGAQADYTLFITTDVGSSNVPSGGDGARRLTAVTDSGDVTLRFEN